MKSLHLITKEIRYIDTDLLLFYSAVRCVFLSITMKKKSVFGIVDLHIWGYLIWV